ncbi:MAG: MotA/TolQ/ExbB proton channel family protein [Betaproteobacteria bacterium]|nr:MotA/TolQ/ExbB proton channel family protein [Betaproteobacteria bacterium]
MNKHSWIGVIFFTAIFISSIFIQGHAALFLNGTALLIVTCGTLGAMLLSYPIGDMRAALQVTRNLHRNPPPTSKEVINTMLDMAVQSRGKGILALENMGEHSTITFLKRALGLLIDGLPDEELSDLLHAEMLHFKQRRAFIERMFRQAALFAPAFGVAGSVVGLIDMLTGITNPDMILQTIPVALVSPLYGIVLANTVFFPVAESIHAKTQKELLIQKLITDGVIIMRSEPNPRRIAIKLESFLTPSARAHENLSLKEIRERLRDLRANGSLRLEPRLAPQIPQ